MKQGMKIVGIVIGGVFGLIVLLNSPAWIRDWMGGISKSDCYEARRILEGSELPAGEKLNYMRVYSQFASHKVGAHLAAAYQQGKRTEIAEMASTCPDFMSFFELHRHKAMTDLLARKSIDLNGEPVSDSMLNWLLAYTKMDSAYREKNRTTIEALLKYATPYGDVQRAQEAREERKIEGARLILQAKEEAGKKTDDSAYNTFCHTNEYFCGSNLTSSQVSNNQRYYTGKKFQNWYLRVADDSSGCIQINEPKSGQNWGRICKAEDVAKFKAKYPAYRRDMAFTVKSGTIRGFLLGPVLEDLEF